MNNKFKALTATAVLFSALFLGCGDSPKTTEVTKVQGKTMGTFYSVTVVGGFEGGENALTALSDATFDKICSIISTFDPKAELARFNEFKSTEPFEISNELGIIIQNTVYQGRRIDGATDITVGPLVNLWGFGKDKKKLVAPSEDEIKKTLALVGFDKFEVRTDGEKTYLIKHDKDVRLDLATIGEGLGADAMARILINKGYKNFMVNVAGASRSLGVNQNGRKWRLGIEDPTSKEPRVLVPVCALDKAVTTAGSYRNFFKDEKSGMVFSHAINPKTGMPVYHRTMSVTVISDSAFESDALDTGLLVLGADKALEWGEKNQYAIATIEYVDGKPKLRHTKNFKKYLDCAKEQN
ncbi:MAG: FAD:protein FMN transferase [Succinivibrio sp.]